PIWPAPMTITFFIAMSISSSYMKISISYLTKNRFSHRTITGSNRQSIVQTALAEHSRRQQSIFFRNVYQNSISLTAATTDRCNAESPTTAFQFVDQG